ncbi:MAG TPA: DNA mismatch repair protein MutS [Candidatus Binatia bacterium]
MSFSILFPSTEHKKETAQAPDFFADLNLDQVVDAITAGKEEYNLKPFFYTSLHDADLIRYRQEVIQDLENSALFEVVKSFAEEMRAMRQHLAQADKLYYQLQKQSWFLDAVDIYCDAVASLAHSLSGLDVKSRGFAGLREYLSSYSQSAAFTMLVQETKKVKADLASVQYCVLIKGDRFTVRNYTSEADYSAQVENTFAKFKQAGVKDYRAKFPTEPEMNHIEAKVLEFVSQLYREIFSELKNYCSRNNNYLDETVSAFDREVQFYVAYLEYMLRFKKAQLSFCYPQVSDRDKQIFANEAFDLALAQTIINEKSSIICNDFYLKGKERIFVVSGPNQGGKTTFARMFGQLHFLGALGCPVPGREARLFLFDKLLTHFEKEENIKDLRGKLEDDLIRIHAILEQAGPNSIVIINEIFTSTTANDALFLSKKVLQRLIELDSLSVCVTFIEELASLSDKTVSVASTVIPENPSLRTFKVVRKPADGLAYAISIAEKYRVTYRDLRARIHS